MSTAPVPNATARLVPLDQLRGLIMVVMALDHASLFIAHQHGSEFFAGPHTRYTSLLAFFTRFVTHLCAPGFFFLMGAGMALFAGSRRALGWSEGRIARYFLLRGAVLLIVNQVLESPAWLLGTLGSGGPGGGGPRVFFTVITGLGMAMMAGTLLLRLGRGALAVSIGLLLLCSALVPQLDYSFASGPLWLRFLLFPGISSSVIVLYPLLPWLGICGLGIAYGEWLRSGGSSDGDRERPLRSAPLLGLLMIGLAIALRAGRGFGNLAFPRDGSLIEFLNFVKYPPALVFALFMIGVNLLLLGALRWRVPVLRVFGQAPLCFYLAHLYLYALVGVLFFRTPTSLPGMYPVWLAGLVPLYFLCRWYRGFKERKPVDSLFRLF